MKLASILSVLALALSGCGEGDSQSDKIHGRVTLDDAPLANANIEFIPKGRTGGLGAFGATDKDGNYSLTSKQLAAEFAQGEYQVVISKRLNPDGSEPDPDTPPIESTAIETLPTHYSDPLKTKLTATISAEKMRYDFELKTPKKQP